MLAMIDLTLIKDVVVLQSIAGGLFFLCAITTMLYFFQRSDMKDWKKKYLELRSIVMRDTKKMRDIVFELDKGE